VRLCIGLAVLSIGPARGPCYVVRILWTALGPPWRRTFPRVQTHSVRPVCWRWPRWWACRGFFRVGRSAAGRGWLVRPDGTPMFYHGVCALWMPDNFQGPEAVEFRRHRERENGRDSGDSSGTASTRWPATGSMRWARSLPPRGPEECDEPMGWPVAVARRTRHRGQGHRGNHHNQQGEMRKR
jgi:hypothetical protein